MNLYLMRHAIAEARDDSAYPDDSQRPLSAPGRRKMVKIASGLKELGLGFDLILSSPSLRARETAEIMAKRFGLKDHLVFTDHLSPLGHADQLIAEIRAQYTVEHLLLVGHEPYMSSLASMLLAGNGSVEITMKKGGLCCLSVAELRYAQCAVLEYLLTPGQMVAMVQ
ncbi:MAG: phosphohistidine phosphatase SixA [Chloroflexota bacterium]